MNGPRVTRTVVFAALASWLSALFVAGIAAQMYGLWSWSPSPDAALSVASFIVAAFVAVLFIPPEITHEES